jgi:hypothetical protein
VHDEMISYFAHVGSESCSSGDKIIHVKILIVSRIGIIAMLVFHISPSLEY